MNKTLITAALVAGSISVVSANGYNTGGYSGIGGAAASSSAVVSGNTLSGGNGFQTSGASANNVTSAGATKTYTPNGVVVSAHTASAGDTSTFSFGRGEGTTKAGAIQGGKADADVTAYTGDRDYHSGHSHNGWNRNFTWDKTKASGYGHVTIDSSVAQGSIAASKVTDKGESYQWSGAGASNTTSGYVTVDADARHNKASLDLTAGTASAGDTYAYGFGKVKQNGIGFSGGAATQDGNAWAGARGGISINKGTGYHHYRHDHRNTTDSGKGFAKVNSDASVETKSIAGGFNTHNGDTFAWSQAGNEATAGVKQRFKNNGVKQKTYATSETGALAGGWKAGQGYSSFYADGKGTGFAKGYFNGDVDVSHSYSDPVQNGCVANGGTGNCGIGNGLGGGNGTGNEGGGNGPT